MVMTDDEMKHALDTWQGLVRMITSADEAQCRRLLSLEKKRQGGPRKMFLLRVHSRLNYVRAHAERDGLLRLVSQPRVVRRAASRR